MLRGAGGAPGPEERIRQHGRHLSLHLMRSIATVGGPNPIQALPAEQ